MDLHEKIDLLGRAFAFGETDALAEYLNKDCQYHSDYAQKHLTSSEQIIKSMKRVAEAIEKAKEEEGENCAYTYKVVKISEYLNDGITIDDLYGDTFFDVCEDGILLYQFDDPNPVAIVYAKITPGGTFTEINLSRNKKWFNLKFYNEDRLEDSEKDVPYTVKPMSNHDRQVKELQSVWTHQKTELQNLDDQEVYIWRQGDKFIKGWLDNNGYKVLESQVFEDCIGYRCNRNNYAYTVYMFAYGKTKTSQLDGEFCQKLLEYELSAQSTVLIVYLNVKRKEIDGQFEYKVCCYTGEEDGHIELWRLIEVAGKPILDYYPRKEMMDVLYKLMYAFNRSSMDIYDCIISPKNPAFQGLEYPGSFMNSAFYRSLVNLHEKYGDMKLGFVRFNDVIYSSVPYLEEYGFFSFRVDNNTNRITEVTAYPFEGKNRKVAEFIRTDEKEPEDLYDFVPTMKSVKPLKPVDTERFAVMITYDNGECRKYVLPIDIANEKDEVISYDSHVFTDKIWKSMQIIEHHQAEISGYPNRGQAILFENGFSASGMLCYIEGTRYEEPVPCNAIVYDDGKHRLIKKWIWNAESVYIDEETSLLKTLLSGQAFNWYGLSTFALPDGTSRCSLDFDYIDDFKEGLARVCKYGFGFGYIDESMNFVIPMQYDNAENFENGKAKVKRNNDWFFINKNGEETPITASPISEKYQDVGEYSEGLCKVSTLRLGFMDLAYHSDYSEMAGTWGYVDENGKEVIAPQYIYAYDFSGGKAIVCKGKWTIDTKWDNKYHTGKYWTEEELWGAIDKNGTDIIPCKFDEIKFFDDEPDIYMAHFGGWKEGKWGVIDGHGNWLADPVFEDIGYDYSDGLFTFYDKDSWDDDALIGIYDLKQNKVVFKPQFYDVTFLNDGWILVEVNDEEQGRHIEKIIDLAGKEKFHSIYSSIYAWKEPYEVVIRDDSGDLHGLIDENGNVILPCKYNTTWNGISYETKRIVFVENEKQGIMDFDGKVLVEPKYLEIHGMDNPLLTVRVGEKDNYTEGLVTQDGKEVVPPEYSRISWNKDNRIICCKDGCCEMLCLEEL